MKTLARWAAALAFAFAAGVGLSYGQTYAPDALAPLFNSAAPIVLVAGLASLASRRWPGAVALGALSAPALVAGYYVASHLRGFAGSAGNIAMWGAAGVIFGAGIGIAWWLLRTPASPWLRAAGAALFPGIAIGEAWHGLTRIADTTPAAYWWAQAVVGTAMLVLLAAWRLPTWPARLWAVGYTAAIAAAIYAIYGAA